VTRNFLAGKLLQLVDEQKARMKLWGHIHRQRCWQAQW